MKLPDVHEVVLDNGFRALLVVRRSLPVVASTLFYRVGSRDERTGETGLSHFLEHMMFKGTERYAKGEIDMLTAKLGGSNNAFTSHDVTAYYFALKSDRWETALEIEASRMTGCLLDEDEFEAEKSVVLEEMAMGEDDPWSRLYQAAEAESYRVHPYRHPIIGWRADVEGVSAEAMRGYYARHYGPNRAFLVAVGDLDPERAALRVEQLFGALPASAVARAEVIQEPEPGGPRLAVERFVQATDTTRVVVCVPTCRMAEPDDFVLDIAAHVLGGSKTSRLYRRLVLEEQIATQVWVNNEVRLDPGLFSVSLELREGVPAERGEAVVREELAALQRHRGPTATELRQARTQLRSTFLFEEETVLNVALRIGRFEAMTSQGHGLLAEVEQRYAAVTARDVKAALARYCAPERWTTTRLLPELPKAARRAARAGRKGAARR